MWVEQTVSVVLRDHKVLRVIQVLQVQQAHKVCQVQQDLLLFLSSFLVDKRFLLLNTHKHSLLYRLTARDSSKWTVYWLRFPNG